MKGLAVRSLAIVIGLLATGCSQQRAVNPNTFPCVPHGCNDAGFGCQFDPCPVGTLCKVETFGLLGPKKSCIPAPPGCNLQNICGCSAVSPDSGVVCTGCFQQDGGWFGCFTMSDAFP
jgi:hypothetical protein